MYRIMIIEDNEKIRNELCDFLGKNGYEALGPDDFEHTLDIIHKEQPDLLLPGLESSSCGWSFYLSGGAQKQ